MALEQKHYREAIRVIRSSKVDSQAIIGYLERNGFEDIALYFVTEPRARFNLAIRCGNLDIANECATQLNEPAIWNELAAEALRQGNHAIVEVCYQQTKSFEKLSFLYLVTGNRAKLQKMLEIADRRQDAMSRFFNAMYLGDASARVQLLRDVGQTTLAYITAVAYGLEEAAAAARALLEEQGLPVPEVAPVEQPLEPPAPLETASASPLLEMPRSLFDRVMEEEAHAEPAGPAEAAERLEEEFASVDEDAASQDAQNSPSSQGETNEWVRDLDLSEEEEVGWGDDLELSDEESAPMPTEEREVPAAGASASVQWCANSSLAYDHAAAGDVAAACRLLSRQIGLRAVKPLAPALRSCFLSVQAETAGFPSLPPLATPLQRSAAPALPLAVYRLQHALQIAKMGMKCFQAGRFEDALNAFRSLLVIVPVVVADSKEEEAELRQLVDMAREYLLAVRIELLRRDIPAGDARSLELAAFMTHCQLQNAHILLALNSAMVAAFKAENFIDAAGFANRILANPEIKTPRNAPLEQKARKVLQRSEREGRNAVETHYDPNSPLTLNAATLEPMDKAAGTAKCPFCGAVYAAGEEGRLCSVCGMAQVGLETVGLVCLNARKWFVCYKQK